MRSNHMNKLYEYFTYDIIIIIGWHLLEMFKLEQINALK